LIACRCLKRFEEWLADQIKVTCLGVVVSSIAGVVVAYITSGAEFDKKLADAQVTVGELRRDLVATSLQATALREELAAYWSIA
jgi:hypothetical protein